jgi:hypothetical protein
MSTATTSVSAINVNAMGVQDFDAAIKQGLMKAKEVLDILDARIAKRQANNKPLVAGVVKFRNELATGYSSATGHSVGQVPMPAYAVKPSTSSIPTSPEQAADAVFLAVGAANVGAVIGRLTALMAGTATVKQ